MPPSSLLNMSSEINDLVISASRQCVIELEGTTFKYEPIFGNMFRQTVSDIVGQAFTAQNVAQDTVVESTAKDTPTAQSGLMSLVATLFGPGGKPSEESPEIEDFKKTIFYLKQAVNSLTTVFDLKAPTADDSPSRYGGGGSGGGVGGRTSVNTPEMVSDHGTECQVLTPHGRLGRLDFSFFVNSILMLKLLL